MAPVGEEGLVYSGGEDAYPFNQIARPAPRGHLAKTKRATGWLLMQHLAAAAEAAGAVPRFDTRVDRLVVDHGRVVGVQARQFADTVHLRARRGVVLTAGGFVFNDDMLRRHCPPLVRGSFKVGTEGDDGRAIRMAQALGAAVRNMHSGEVSLPITPPRGLIRGILVNGRGQRFINEDTYMGRVGRTALYEQDGEVYLIVDEETYEPNWMGLKATWVCETAAELEKEIGLPLGAAGGDRRPLQPARRAGGGPGLPQGARLGPAPPAAAGRLRPPGRPGALRPVHPRRSRHRRRRVGPRPRRPAGPRALRRRADDRRRLCPRLRQRPVHRRQHPVRPVRRPDRGHRTGLTGVTSGGEETPAVVSPDRRLVDGGTQPDGDVGPDDTGRGRLLGLATAAVTFLAIVFLAGAIADVPAAFSKVHGEDWLWLVPAIGSAAAVFFAAAVALSGAVDIRLPPGRTVLLEVGRSFTTMATPGGVGSFALTVRFVQRLGIEVAAASASAALVSVGSLLVDLVALLFGGILSASTFQTENLHSAAGSDGWLLLAGVVVLAAAVAAVWHFPRLHRRVVPQLKMAGGMVRSVSRRPRKALRLVVGQALLLAAEVACLYCTARAGPPAHQHRPAADPRRAGHDGPAGRPGPRCPRAPPKPSWWRG